MRIDPDQVLWSAPEPERAGRPLLLLLHGHNLDESVGFELRHQLPSNHPARSDHQDQHRYPLPRSITPLACHRLRRRGWPGCDIGRGGNPGKDIRMSRLWRRVSSVTYSHTIHRRNHR